MWPIIVLALFCNLLAQSRLLPPFKKASTDHEAGDGQIWAVLVAGSNGWYNYRHQADICHAYQILRRHGVDEDHIITLMYDDIAHNIQNPYPGKIINKPGGKDVYAGVKIDYSGKHVTPENFLAILKGQKNKVKGGNGRVLESKKNDRIFVFFSDHGAPGIIVFPNDDLHVKDLNSALKYMHEKQKFAQLTFYLEACESGSMFESFLPKDINVYAVTAANAEESSWGDYCGIPPVQTCLGDQFSVAWMEDSDAEDIEKEDLNKQYKVVKVRTNQSHVMQYGELDWTDEPVGYFQGRETAEKQIVAGDDLKGVHYEQWPSREVPLRYLEALLKSETDPDRIEDIQEQIYSLKMKRQIMKSHIQALTKKIVKDAETRRRIQNTRGSKINNIDCHHDVAKAFSRICYKLSENAYAAEYLHMVVNMCDVVETQVILDEMMDHCLETPVRFVL